MSNQPPQPEPGPGENPFSVNPYAPTAHTGDLGPTTDDPEGYRRAYLNHEASVKSIGFLYLFGAILLVPIGVLMIAAFWLDEDVSDRGILLGIGAGYLGVGLLQIYTGVGLRRLQNPARVIAIIFSILGLIGFPIGTLISAYFLYLLVGKKGQVVFSDEYREVVRKTPHIKYKTSMVVWILLGLLLLLLTFGMMSILFVGA